MKNLAACTTLLISGLLLVHNSYAQDINDKALAINLTSNNSERFNSSLNENAATPLLKKDDVVINMDMIQSFHRCYDKIQPFSMVEYFKGDGSEISVKYMAYMRVRFDNSAETSENFQNALNTEIKKINSEIKNNKTFTASVAYSECQVKEPPVELARSEQSEVSKQKPVYSDKEKSKKVKWNNIKS